MPRGTPRAYQLAKELGISLTGVHGSGKNHYITEDDVRALAEAEGIEIPEPEVETATEPEVGTVPSDFDRDVMGPVEGLILADEIVLPVSVVERLRFRQDDAHGNWVGNDLLALRSPTAQPNHPMNVHKREFYTIEPAYFTRKGQEPTIQPDGSNGAGSDHDDPELGDTGHPTEEAMEGFAISGV